MYLFFGLFFFDWVIFNFFATSQNSKSVANYRSSSRSYITKITATFCCFVPSYDCTVLLFLRNYFCHFRNIFSMLSKAINVKSLITEHFPVKLIWKASIVLDCRILTYNKELVQQRSKITQLNRPLPVLLLHPGDRTGSCRTTLVC